MYSQNLACKGICNALLIFARIDKVKLVMNRVQFDTLKS